MTTASVSFSISGEFITEHVRDRWHEGDHQGALSVLECIVDGEEPISLDSQREIIEGRKCFKGVNELCLEDDHWEPPEGYRPLKGALMHGRDREELGQRRREEAEGLIWDAVKMSKSFTGFHCFGSKTPTKKQTSKIWDYS